MSTPVGSGSFPKPGIFTALAYANRSTAVRRTIIYVSDGYNPCPGTDLSQSSEEILKEVAERNGQRVRINTVYIGPVDEAEEDFMRKLAAQNGGRYTRSVERAN